MSRANVQRFNEVLSSKGSQVGRDRPRQLSISQKSGAQKSVFSKDNAPSLRSKRLSEIPNMETRSKARSFIGSAAPSRGSIFQKRAMENIRVDQDNLSKKIEADKQAHHRSLKADELRQL
mmetsp:Transcript_33354/g.51129  ORF Transcript_33354/g.51129 Transcript_33354/m.51129 type:complete len:120 (+) Transcript_33354:576-935(+)